MLVKNIHLITVRIVKGDELEWWEVSDEAVMAESTITASLSKVLGQTERGGLLKSRHIYQNRVKFQIISGDLLKRLFCAHIQFMANCITPPMFKVQRV